jgi:hypothetical protein
MAEERPGDRFMVKGALGTLFSDSDVYISSHRRIPSPKGIEKEWERTLRDEVVVHHQRRLENFETQARAYRFRDVCSKNSVRNLVLSGEPPRDSWLSAAEKHYSPQERVAILRRLIHSLREYPNYELALVENEHHSIFRAWWMVKGDHFVAIECWPPTSRQEHGAEQKYEEMNLGITHPVLVEAFRSYFLSMWDSLEPAAKDKRRIIAWLERQLKIAEGRVGLEVSEVTTD